MGRGVEQLLPRRKHKDGQSTFENVLVVIRKTQIKMRYPTPVRMGF